MLRILRVISGIAKGHKLKTLDGTATRPTSDRVKESLFNIISYYINDKVVLDLFAGTGSLGIEALSRGASACTFVDSNPKCIQIINDNLMHTKLITKAYVINCSYREAIDKFKKYKKVFDIVFLDPPYNKNFIQESLKLLAYSGIITNGGIIVAEKSTKDEVPQNVGDIKLFDQRKYGDTVLCFYKVETDIIM